MTTAIQRRGGTTAQHASFTGLAREVTVDTDKHVLVVHDGETAGGFPSITADQVEALIAAAIAALPAPRIHNVGEIFAHGGTTAPAGCMILPQVATNVSRTTYAALFAVYGTTYGAGDGSTTFGLPWAPAGYALIQASNAANVGVHSAGAVISHAHSASGSSAFTGVVPMSVEGSGAGANAVAPTTANGAAPGIATSVTVNAAGGANNLAAGLAVTYCIQMT